MAWCPEKDYGSSDKCKDLEAVVDSNDLVCAKVKTSEDEESVVNYQCVLPKLCEVKNMWPDIPKNTSIVTEVSCNQ
eukprot:CAMPEP_0170496844 /NCGR_PEP_ID=MMETSP0208-20121228/22870_1 /TAXON_ID=197538 /ORGANISM="Strombidium inclinatum, Strain S3" /LENGTH=75 /DNA_ID=CAMNT_0010773481 /DNA_START=291 /DNA_END=518 /DNA_ORIENTATION=-